MDRYPDLEFGTAVGATLDALVTSYIDGVIRVLAKAGIDEPIASVCISPGQEEDLDTLPRIYAGRAADRDRLVRDGPDHWMEAWNPYAYRDEEDQVHPTVVVRDEYADEEYLEMPAEAARGWEVVRDSLEGRCLDPTYWLHARVAHRLNRLVLPIPVTEDVAVWVFHFDAGPDEVREMLEAVLRPETFGALQSIGLIGDP
jgi:hypothetical protein